MPTGLASRQDGFDLRPDDGPYLGPALFSALAEGVGMLVFADAGAVGVVIELDVLFTPPEEHGVARAEHGVDGGEEGFGPLSNGADRGRAPVVGAGKVRHLAGAEDFV